MNERLHVELDAAMNQLFRLRGVLDPTQAAVGVGASISEVLALRCLAGGAVTHQVLASHLGLEKSTVSRLVDSLAAKGWVNSRRDPTSRRFRIVELTPAGSEAAASVAEAVRRQHDRMLAAMTQEERSAVAIALPALVRVLVEARQQITSGPVDTR